MGSVASWLRCRLTSSLSHIIPPGGHMVMKPHGTKRLTPALLAALARGICSCCSAGPTQLITMSIPSMTSLRDSSEPLMSHFRISMPRSCSFAMAGFWADLGRTRATTSCQEARLMQMLRTISVGVLTKFPASNSPLTMEPPVSPAAPTNKTFMRDMFSSSRDRYT